MFLLNDKPIGLDTAFTTENGTQYPSNWIRLASPEERAAIGITEVADAVRADDRFYWNGDASLPKDIDQIKTMLIAQVKQTAGSLLAATDWRITRAAEGVKPVDVDTLAERSAIRAASDSNEAAIAACTSVEALASLKINWPVF
jgi:hypothetical protein